MTLKVNRRYLALPVSAHAQAKQLCFRNEAGELVFDLSVRLDPVGAQFTYFEDMRLFMGQTLQVSCEPEIALNLHLVDRMPEAGKERFRPIAHFTPARGWINDPNGLVLYEGKYHLFYQHNPVCMNWGNMHWGHAVSDDLMHWEEKEIALFPDELGTVYSGCAVIDECNVSGLKTGEHAPLLLFYTTAGDRSELSKGKEHVQCLAYSIDGGETFVKYENNPIIDHIVGGNRDPKVIFCPELDTYVMALYLDGRTYALFTSDDLLKWQLLQKIDIPGDDECPDFFPLKLDGETYWILSGASDFYLVGKIEGGLFVPVQDVLCLKGSAHTGYAAQTYFGLQDNRRVRIYWNRFNLPGMPFNGSMSTPVELYLNRLDDQIMLGCRPIKELKALHGKRTSGCGRVFLPGEANDVVLSIPTGMGVAEISLFGLKIEIDSENEIVRVGKDEMRARASGGVIRLQLIQDVHSTEIFSEDGTGFFCIGHLADESLNYVAAPEFVHIEAVELVNYRS